MLTGYQHITLLVLCMLPAACYVVNTKSPEGLGLFLGVLREVTTHFIVDARALTKVGGSHVKVHIISPSGTNTDSYITDKGDGTYRVEYTAFEDGRGAEKILH